jgi:hypothetical protein
MSKNETPYAPHLPDGLRVVSAAEWDAMHLAMEPYISEDVEIADALTDTLAVLGLFAPPGQPRPGRCTAQFLPHQREPLAAGMIPNWLQCVYEGGHSSAAHENGEFTWHDGDMGAVPAGSARASSSP